MNQLKSNILKRLTLFFLISCLIVWISKSFFISHGFDFLFFIGGNIFLYLIFILSIFIHMGGDSDSKNPHVSIRPIYLAMMLKMFAFSIAIVIFVLLNKGNINVPSLIALMFIYIIFTTIEVRSLMKVKNKNA